MHNIIKGKLAEHIAKNDYKKRGYKIIPTTIGSDFIAKKINNRSFHDSEYVEVKSGNAKPTKFQKRMMIKARKEGKKYSLYRINDQYLRLYLIKLGMNPLIGEKSRIPNSTSCPQCSLIASELQTIFDKFGLRKMNDGTIRTQSWCRNCKSNSCWRFMC